MQILISCAKTMMSSSSKYVKSEIPRYEKEAQRAIEQLLDYSVAEISDVMHVNNEIAAENMERYARFIADSLNVRPAIQSYAGIVFQQIGVQDFNQADLLFAQKHLFITSFLYGLLRPLDGILPYRLEGNVKLPKTDGISRFEYWKPMLTDYFIDSIKEDDGVLVYLASNEMKKLFDWKRVKKEVKVITPEFKVYSQGKLKTIVVYAKMARGQMTRYILKNRIHNLNDLGKFSPDIETAGIVMQLL